MYSETIETRGIRLGPVRGLVREAYPVGSIESYFHTCLNSLLGNTKDGMIDNKKINWYVAHTRVNQELWIKKKLDELGIENFLPQEEQVRETPLGRKTIRVLLIHGMIFIHTDKATSFSLINDHGLNIVYLKDIEGRHSLIVPDKQMHDFMFLLDFSPSGIEVLNKNLKRGDRVRVIKGPLQGLEGELVRLMGHKRVVIRLEGVVSIATSYIPGSFLERIE